MTRWRHYEGLICHSPSVMSIKVDGSAAMEKGDDLRGGDLLERLCS